ncbi:4-hydroxy-tetrahydrodipicolinate reductase [Nitrospira sp. KM1]|uniref:4-hydroxy-tetrahydrodipicolinate reductase n=1 Tax=Nitrospira sp. KM1 TaxID=1936990 RepID=UPI0013A749E1|nr:4-hydroxy-tetrahydrodipicolinate reductase [Nitrospira sp. KM1]BCA55634.1 4-hydroxy-tetrahydrodipicolinate reductase [Nitrospira sp. KM1]
MVNIIVAGAAGRMGCRLVALIKEAAELRLAGAVEGKGHPAVGQDAGEVAGCDRSGIRITDDLSAVIGQAQAVIDFSVPEATLKNLRTAAQHQRAMVIGTTGFSASELDELKTLAGRIPCVFSPNMSVGVNLICKIISEMAKTLGEDYDIEVIEAHHRLKKDAPSGTALKIAEVLAKAVNRDLNQVGVYSRKGVIGERKKSEIGIQTIRAGDIVGDHTILFGGVGERIEVTHRASSRDTFAQGALRAARWVAGRPPGLYDMTDVLDLK